MNALFHFFNGTHVETTMHVSMMLQKSGHCTPAFSSLAMLSSRSSSSSSSGDEAPVEPDKIVCDGSSLENDEEKEVKVSHRSWVLMSIFSTPREYMKNVEDRRAHRQLIPRDLSREEMMELFQRALERTNLKCLLREMVVACELHHKLQAESNLKEVHYHVIFRMRQNFAHKRLVDYLIEAGCRGHISYPRQGWPNMLKYVLMDSAKMLPIHLDPTPLFWPVKEMNK